MPLTNNTWEAPLIRRFLVWGAPSVTAPSVTAPSVTAPWQTLLPYNPATLAGPSSSSISIIIFIFITIY